jgi:pilus assembly protein Flp/PilA
MLELYVELQNVLVAMKEEDGQDLIEYALLGALIAVACVATMKCVATAINTEFTAITTAFN